MKKTDKKTTGSFKEIPIPLMPVKKGSYKHEQTVSLPHFSFRPVSDKSKL